MGLIKKVKHLSKQVGELDAGEEARRAATPFVRVLYHLYRFIQITVREVIQDQLPLKSMALTFATLLSLVPLLVISFSLFRLFGGGDWFSDTIRPLILENLAPGTGPRVAERLQELIDNAGSITLNGLGVMLLVFAVYAIFSGIESAVNGIWGTRSRAGSIQRLPLYWGLVTIVPILVVGSFAVTTYVQAMPIVSEAVQHVAIGEALFNRLLSMGMVTLGFFLMYRFVPNTQVKTAAAVIGALVSGILYELVKAAFIVYTTDLVQYDLVYGSLAAVPLLLVWVNISWIVVLAGVEVTFVAQHYWTLLNKPKNVELSRHQKDAVAYLMLREATAAFNGERGEVTLDEWANRWNVPPGLAEETAERLRKGGLIERAGKNFSTLLLAKSPARVSLGEVETLLSSEAANEWKWPGSTTWRWLQKWMKRREQASMNAAECETLADLVERMDTESRQLRIVKEAGK